MSILDEPAFPTNAIRDSGFSGMPVREYAAIHLCVPESGDKELDAMIRKAQRQRLAGMAMEGMIADGQSLNEIERRGLPKGKSVADSLATEAHATADALLAELEKP